MGRVEPGGQFAGSAVQGSELRDNRRPFVGGLAGAGVAPESGLARGNEWELGTCGCGNLGMTTALTPGRLTCVVHYAEAIGRVQQHSAGLVATVAGMGCQRDHVSRDGGQSQAPSPCKLHKGWGRGHAVTPTADP